MTKLLVTGGDGFIGSHLVARLLEDGAQVRVLDNLVARGGENIDYLRSLKSGQLEVLIDDVRDPDACHRACQDMDYVLHEAALGSVSRSVEDPQTTHDANATGTLNMLWAAKEAGVKRFVWASSSSVYGDTLDAAAPKSEKLCPAPLSPYAATKVMGEYYASQFFRLYGLATVSLRYFNVFGPRQDPHGPYAAVIPRFILSMIEGRPPTIFGDGLQSRDFTYVDNVVAANLLALKAPKAPGQVINVATGESYSLLDLVARLKTILKSDLEPLFDPPRPGDVLHSKAAINRARDILGFEIVVGFDEGLARTVASLK